MPRISIVTDSTADLTPELIAQHQLRVVPLVVQFDQESYQDGVDLDYKRLFALVDQNKRLPKTASPSPGAYRDAFAAATANGGEAIYVGLSSQLSSSIQNARIAAEMFPAGRVRVFDSANLSTGIGLQVLYACDLAREGKRADEIIAALEQARPKVRTAFMIDTLEYLYMGGRCSGVQALVGSLLRMRPVISVVDGGMTVATKLRGSRQKGLDWMLEQFAADAGQGRVRPDRVFITHTGAHDDAVYMMGEVRKLMPEVQAVIETPAGSVIGSHCGPATIGILYLLK
jgi:DegV family protein with EDD domain